MGPDIQDRPGKLNLCDCVRVDFSSCSLSSTLRLQDPDLRLQLQRGEESQRSESTPNSGQFQLISPANVGASALFSVSRAAVLEQR